MPTVARPDTTHDNKPRQQAQILIDLGFRALLQAYLHGVFVLTAMKLVLWPWLISVAASALRMRTNMVFSPGAIWERLRERA